MGGEMRQRRPWKTPSCRGRGASPLGNCQKGPEYDPPLNHFGIYAAKWRNLGVEPRGFELLTSAVQSQGPIIVEVRRCSKYLAKSRICLWKQLWMFAVVRVGWCTTGVFARVVAYTCAQRINDFLDRPVHQLADLLV